MLDRLLRRMRTSARRAWHRYAVSDVLLTAPVTEGTENYTAFSMIGHSDIVPYLVAIKSFARFGSPNRIAVLCDETVTEADRRLLRFHIPHLKFHEMAAFRRPDVPVGGCWERLLAISELVKEGYVVQLDSDTVTTGVVGEVKEAVRLAAGFLMGIEADQEVGTLQDLHRRTEKNRLRLQSMHVHDVAEFHLARVGLEPSLRYAVGWAAFTGFPRDAAMQNRMLDVVRRMRKAVGQRFDEWGSEMVTSNFLATNASGCRVLPYPKYCTPTKGEQNVDVWHFVGSIRYDDRRYTAVSRRAVDGLMMTDESGPGND